jgi:hypothetical protein
MITTARYWLGKVALVVLIALTPSCSDNRASKVHIDLRDLPAEKQTGFPATANASSPDTLQCPQGGLAALLPSAATGHHDVFLKWNASQRSTDPDRNAVGYCVYRSQVRSEVQKDPTCRLCERVNVTPLENTSCVDNLVKDGETYYYVATAINRNQRLSVTSNEVEVPITSKKQKAVGNPPPGEYPACRASSTASRHDHY